MQYQKNQKVTIQLEKMVPGGIAFGRLPDGRAVFVKGGAPVEEAEVRLTRIKKDFAEAQFVEARRPSIHRVQTAFAPAALAGADWHYLDYPAQLAAKEGILRELLGRLGASVQATIQPIVGADLRWRYRNKIELTFGLDEFDQVRLGFHEPGRFDQILPTADVALFPDIVQEIIEKVTSWANREQLSAYQPRRQTGLLRNLVVRRVEHGAELVINLVTSPGSMPTELLKHELREVPLSGLVWSENASPATIVRLDSMTVLTGQPKLTEVFLGVPIRYSIGSFFQTNTSMAEKLTKTLIDRVLALKPSRIVDAYAGVGGYGLLLAQHGSEVVSIEEQTSSSLDAVWNREALQLTNQMKIVNRSMEAYLLEQRLPAGSVVIVDPPRAGLHPKTLAALIAAPIDHVFYISCNPATLARDLALLTEQFQSVFIQPLDLFPQTSHLETLVELHRQ